MIARVLCVDFEDPRRRVNPQGAILARVEGLPVRLSQTAHRMSDVIQEMLRERITLSVSYSPGLRLLLPEEVEVFERLLAPYAEVGTTLPNDAFVVRLLASMDRELPEAEHLGNIAAIRAAWGDDGEVGNMLRRHIYTTLEREWRAAFPKALAAQLDQVERWLLTLTFLLVRPGDVYRLQNLLQLRAS